MLPDRQKSNNKQRTGEHQDSCSGSVRVVNGQKEGSLDAQLSQAINQQILEIFFSKDVLEALPA